MDKARTDKLIQAALETGADFADIFVEETRNAQATIRDGKIETASSGIDYGIGIRLVRNLQVYYAFTSIDEEEGLLGLIHSLADAMETSGSSPLTRLQQRDLPPEHTILKNPADIGQQAKLHYLKLADSAARSASPLIRQVSASLMDSESHVLIANSEGLYAEDFRVRTRFSVATVAERDGEIFSAHEAPGAMKGFEFFETTDVESLSRKAAQRSLLMLDADYIEGKKMPVVLGNGFGGVIFHEACGHPLETEAVRLNASPFVGKLNEKIAHEALTAIDDGTVENSWGSVRIDDEGTPTQKTTLIENGILKNFLSDRIGAEQLSLPLTGSARRESYRYAPVSRMRNTYIAAGPHDPSELIAGADDGLYAAKMGGGSVNPSTGEFNFAVEEGYRIRNGKIAEPVRGATLTGKGDEIMLKISAVANDLELAAGMCGASSGMVPVTVGQPTIRVDDILVGGR